MRPVISFGYTNHHGKTANRRVIPDALEYIQAPGFGYPPGWFLSGMCLDKNERRSFALSNMTLPDVANWVLLPFNKPTLNDGRNVKLSTGAVLNVFHITALYPIKNHEGWDYRYRIVLHGHEMISAYSSMAEAMVDYQLILDAMAQAGKPSVRVSVTEPEVTADLVKKRLAEACREQRVADASPFADAPVVSCAQEIPSQRATGASTAQSACPTEPKDKADD